MSSIFLLSGGGRWLQYRAFEKLELPRLRRMPNPARFENRDRTTKIPRYRLVWPGQEYNLERQPPMDALPPELLHWWEHGEKGFKDRGRDQSVREWLKEGPFPGTPDAWPEGLQYHLAVNWNHYAKYVDPMVEMPVCGLPHEVVQSVLKTEFAVDETYEATIRYLEWLGTSMRENPLFDGGFDTNIRESLQEIPIVAIRKYFMMLGDCIYNEETQRWARGGFKRQWAKLACYLWWVGRTGCALYRSHAGIERKQRRPGNLSEAEIHKLWKTALSDENVDPWEREGALWDALGAWDFWRSRDNSRLGGAPVFTSADELAEAVKKAAEDAGVEMHGGKEPESEPEEQKMPYMRDETVFHWDKFIDDPPPGALEQLVCDIADAVQEEMEGRPRQEVTITFDFDATQRITDAWLRIIQRMFATFYRIDVVDMRPHIMQQYEALEVR